MLECGMRSSDPGIEDEGRLISYKELLAGLLRLGGGDREGNFLDADASDEVEDADNGAMGRILVAADIDGKVGVRAEFVRKVAAYLSEVHLGLFDEQIPGFVHRDINDVGVEVAFCHDGGGQIQLDGLKLNHAEARHHEGGEQEEHDID